MDQAFSGKLDAKLEAGVDRAFTGAVSNCFPSLAPDAASG
jgi:hypothetical protein